MKKHKLSFGLSENVISAIQKIFANYSSIDEVILYGSRAKGNFRQGSDIDLTLIGNISHQELNQIALQLDDLLLPYTIDLSIFKNIDNCDLIEHIKYLGKVFYKRES